jgi:NitT/TauT family transport system substrate-binding protein
MISRRRFTALALTATTALSLLGACGSSDEPTAETTALTATASTGESPEPANTLTTIRVGSSRLSHLAAIVIGQQQGFFEDHGLELELELDNAELTGVPALIGGQIDFGNSDLVSLLAATSEGIPIQAILPASASTGIRGEDYGALLVGPDSTIQSPRELEGKVVSSNILTNIAALAVREAVRADGGDPDQLELIEVNFPDVPTALVTGSVEASWCIEPFKSAAIAQGARVIAWGFEDIYPEVTVSAWITSTDFATKNPALVQAFKAATQESYEYARAHLDDVKAILPEITSVSPEVAQSVILTSWKDELTEAELAKVLASAKSAGLVTKDPDLTQVLFRG